MGGASFTEYVGAWWWWLSLGILPRPFAVRISDPERRRRTNEKMKAIAIDLTVCVATIEIATDMRQL
jgi:hypothetical protein